MQFRVPNHPIEFEIPDAWLQAANALGFIPKTPAYLASSDPTWATTSIPLAAIAPPVRNVGVQGLHEERTVSILQAITSGQILPPLTADQPPGMQEFRYRV